MSDESFHEKMLGGKLLASVSRSFYLTLKALPKVLREPVSMAYLLARTADTIADTTQVPADTRLQCLGRFRSLVMGTQDEEEERGLAILLQGRFCPHQTDEAEARLMEHIRDALAWLRTLGGKQLEAVKNVLDPIIQGQKLDIERFPGDGRIRAIKTAAELDEYTWLVAGCVGEFWTRLCFAEMKQAFDGQLDDESLVNLGVRYGKGLQLVNILRDVPKDLAMGRCYLPEEDLTGTGRHLAELRLSPRVLDPIRAAWLERCREHLACGLCYVNSISHGRLRYATALPLLIAARTCALLKDGGWEALSTGVKITRLEVARILAEAALACRKPGELTKLYGKLSGAEGASSQG